MASFIRKVPTASGARAVQIVHKQGRQVVGIEHIGAAHDDGQLAVLMEIARQRLLPGQDSLDLAAAGAPAAVSVSSGVGAGARVKSMSSRLLWDVLVGAYERLGFDVVGDETFKDLVLARIIEPTSKAATIRVLGEIGVPCPGLRTIFRSLDRCVARDHRDLLAKACVARVAGGGPIVMVMYDVTVRHEVLVVRMEVRDHHRGRCRSGGRAAAAMSWTTPHPGEPGPVPAWTATSTAPAARLGSARVSSARLDMPHLAPPS